MLSWIKLLKPAFGHPAGTVLEVTATLAAGAVAAGDAIAVTGPDGPPLPVGVAPQSQFDSAVAALIPSASASATSAALEAAFDAWLAAAGGATPTPPPSPTPTFALLTELGDTLTTEAGDVLVLA